MSGSPTNIGLDAVVARAQHQAEGEIAAIERTRRNTPFILLANGEESVDELFGLNEPFKPVFVRMHFSVRPNQAVAAPTYSSLKISLDSNDGDQHDTTLYIYDQRGLTRDVNLVWTREEISNPSGWVFNRADQLRIEWTNIDLVRWGLQVGLIGV